MTIPLLETGNNPHGPVIQELPPSDGMNMPKGRPEKASQSLCAQSGQPNKAIVKEFPLFSGATAVPFNPSPIE